MYNITQCGTGSWGRWGGRKDEGVKGHCGKSLPIFPILVGFHSPTIHKTQFFYFQVMFLKWYYIILLFYLSTIFFIPVHVCNCQNCSEVFNVKFILYVIDFFTKVTLKFKWSCVCLWFGDVIISGNFVQPHRYFWSWIFVTCLR